MGSCGRTLIVVGMVLALASADCTRPTSQSGKSPTGKSSDVPDAPTASPDSPPGDGSGSQAPWARRVTPDQAGPAGAQHIIVFETHAPAGGQYEGDIDVSAQRVSPAGDKLWNDGDLIDIMSGAYIEQRPVVLPDGAGGVIVVAEAVAREGEHVGDWEILAQRVSSNGRLLWEDGERSVIVAASLWSERRPVVVPDGQGGAFVFYEAHAPADSEWAGDVDIHGQHISADGRLLWEDGEKSVQVAYAAALEQAPIAVPDGAGGSIVVFQVARREGEYAGDWEVYAQRVGPDGQLLWGDDEGSALVADSTWLETMPVAIEDGEGGALVFFQAEATAGEYAGDIDIRGQRISARGEVLWEDGEASVGILTAGALECAPVAVPDGNGGAIVICEAATRQGEFAGDWEILAQRVSSGGRLLWEDGEGPVIVSATKLHERTACALPDGAGGAVVAFEAHGPEGSEWAGDVDVFAQRVSANGQVLWSEEGEGGALLVSSSVGTSSRRHASSPTGPEA